MNKRTFPVVLALFCFSALIIIGCGGGPQHKPPEWVYKKPVEKGVLYGRGCADSMVNYELTSEKAEQMARADIAQALDVRLRGMTVNWAKESKELFDKAGYSVSKFERNIDSVFSTRLMGAQIVEWYEFPDTGRTCALCKLDTQAVKSIIMDMQEMVKGLVATAKEGKELSEEEIVKIDAQAADFRDKMDTVLKDLGLE